MNTITLTVPAALIPLLREGAYAVSRDISEAINSTDDLPGCRDRLSGVCDLLDAIEDDEDTTLDVSEHAPTLKAVVELMLGVLPYQAGELADDDPAKPEREDEIRLLRQFDAQLRGALS